MRLTLLSGASPAIRLIPTSSHSFEPSSTSYSKNENRVSCLKFPLTYFQQPTAKRPRDPWLPLPFWECCSRSHQTFLFFHARCNSSASTIQLSRHMTKAYSFYGRGRELHATFSNESFLPSGRIDSMFEFSLRDIAAAR